MKDSNSMNTFVGIPNQYQKVLKEAENKRQSKIEILETLSGGRSGALLYLVTETKAVSKEKHQCILKLYKNPRQTQDEYERVRNIQQISPKFSSQHIAGLFGEPARIGNITAIFYEIAGHSLQKYRPISTYVQSSKKLKAAFKTISSGLLEDWDNSFQFSSKRVLPQEILSRWLKYRIDQRKGNIEKFLAEDCDVNPDILSIGIKDSIFPNPFAYARNPTYWNNTIKLDTLIGMQHGDLNINNLLTSFMVNDELENYYLIDFAHSSIGEYLFFDHLYLELSYLIDILMSPQASVVEWLKFIFVLAEQDLPNPQMYDIPVNYEGICNVILSSRNAFNEWLKENHSRLHDHLWGQFRLAAVAAGLNFCNKSSLSTKARLGAFIFAAAHLKRYCELFNIPISSSAQELKLTNLDFDFDPENDWDLFLDACYNFDNQHLYILVTGPQDSENSAVLNAIGRVDWMAILDFDPNTQIQGLHTFASSELETHRSLHLLTKSEDVTKLINSFNTTYWYSAYGLTGRSETKVDAESLNYEVGYRQWSREYPQNLRIFLNKLAKSSNELPVVIIFCWDAIPYLRRICVSSQFFVVEQVQTRI